MLLKDLLTYLLTYLDPKIQTIMFNTAATLESNMADTGSSNLWFYWISWPRKCGARHWNHISICLSFKVTGKSMCNMAAILKFNMAATRARFRVWT